ncbi:MAG: hypothetical protein FWG92_03250 [Leptospirales bacterium]|nr:hypothetical protein [Leptospirales bacterium]
MKTIFISTEYLEDGCLPGLHSGEAFNKLLNEYSIMESQIVYFSAGEGCIKEILIKKEPTYSF